MPFRRRVVVPTAFLTTLLLTLTIALVGPAVARADADGEGSPDGPSPHAAEDLETEEIEPEDVGMDDLDADALPSWIDVRHAEATNRAQALVQWTDAFFGAPVQDAERADTFVRVIVSDQWDRADGHDFKLRLRGQVNLPAISNRLDLVFAGEDSENVATDDSASRSEEAGLRLNLSDKKRARFDATLSVSSGPGLVPGVRFRFQDDLGENAWYRFTQRFQYDTDKGNRAITELGLNRYLAEGQLLRWKGRVRYREDKGFWDWRSSIVYRRWFDDHDEFPSAIEYFLGWGGRDEPELRTSDFRLGARYRRQWLRPFLYLELEPNFALRQDEVEEKRKWYPGLTVRLEVMLDESLTR